MCDELTGRTILVTGGTGDLGGAAARLMAAHGATVALADRRAPHASGLEVPLPHYAVDVRHRASVESLFQCLTEEGLEPDTVICNAGFVHNASFLDVSEEDWTETPHCITVDLTFREMLPHE